VKLKVLAVSSVAFFAMAAAASAQTTVVEPIGSHLPYQRWVDESAVPTPDVTIEVIETEAGHGCPGRQFDYIACTAPWERKIWIDEAGAVSRRPREIFMHELGHNFDADVLPEWARERFDALEGLGGPWVITEEPQPMTPSEWFAETYAQCAMVPFVSLAAMHALGLGPIAGAEPIGGRDAYNKVCRMLKRLQGSRA